MQANPRIIPSRHLARDFARTQVRITTQVKTAGIAGMKAFGRGGLTTDKDTGHGNIDQNAFNTARLIAQHTRVATFKPPALPAYLILRNHT